MITQAEYDKCLRGYQITDCAVRSQGYFHFIARNIEESAEASPISEARVSKREIGYYGDEPAGARMGWQGFENFESTFVGAAALPVDQVVCVDTGGMVFARGGGSSDFESPIPKRREGPRRGAVQRIRMVHGQLYVVGSGHTVCRRRGLDDWESLALDLPLETRADADDADRSANMAFEDIDGFSASDLYAVAGRGRVWHCDGNRWTQLAFPSNMLMHSVCCAGDGQVYIGAQSGSVFRGRGQEWTLLHRGDMTLPFKDIVWHAGKVWATSDHGLWQIDGNTVTRLELPSAITVCAGNLSAAGGMLLMAGMHGAAFHDGAAWHAIFNRNEMEP